MQNVIQHSSVKEDNILRSNSLDLHVVDQLLVRYFAYVRHWEKDGSIAEHYTRNFRKASDSVRRKVLYNILAEFGILTKDGLELNGTHQLLVC
jgi:hypothetical protein